MMQPYFLLKSLRPPTPTPTVTLFPYTTLTRSLTCSAVRCDAGSFPVARVAAWTKLVGAGAPGCRLGALAGTGATVVGSGFRLAVARGEASRLHEIGRAQV